MKAPVKYGLIFGMIYVIARLIYHNTVGISEIERWLFPMMNMLLVMMAILFAIIATHRSQPKEDRTFLVDFKGGMQGGMMYMVVYATFYLLFYYAIAPQYLPGKVDQAMTMQTEAFNDQFGEGKPVSTFEADQLYYDRELMATTATPKDTFVKYEKIMDETLQGMRSFYSVKGDLPLSILGILMMSFSYTLILTIFVRRFLTRIL